MVISPAGADFMTLARTTIAILALSGAALAQPAGAQELKPWRNALIQPKSDAGFYLMDSKRGFFAKEGLKVDNLEVKDDTIGFKALLSGEVDSYFGTAGALAAVARGADVKFVRSEERRVGKECRSRRSPYH